ncbi:hypothetical protein AUJ84_02565 [Candidatus Pacearchaeota archaeon CG1_02_32_132]|nr:MAG: hypothetical protein AUJ84_02565 [Candidatus Pacearchaeota archaeon CG1_02_32_132]
MVEKDIKAFPDYEYEIVEGDLEAPKRSLGTHGLYLRINGILEGEEDSYFYYIDYTPENENYTITGTTFSLNAIPSEVEDKAWDIVKDKNEVKSFLRKHPFSSKIYRREASDGNIQKIENNYIRLIIDSGKDVDLPEHPRLSLIIDLENNSIINQNVLGAKNSP